MRNLQFNFWEKKSCRETTFFFAFCVLVNCIEMSISSEELQSSISMAWVFPSGEKKSFLFFLFLFFNYFCFHFVKCFAYVVARFTTYNFNETRISIVDRLPQFQLFENTYLALESWWHTAIQNKNFTNIKYPMDFYCRHY